MNKEKHMNVDIGLRVFRDDIDSYVAYSADDAWSLRDDLIGNEEGEENEFAEQPQSMKIKIMDENFEPESAVEKTCAEWCEFNGRGFLCSTEW